MINLWSQKSRLLASYRRSGQLEIRDLGPAEYVGFIRKGTTAPHGAIKVVSDFPGWRKVYWADYDARKRDVENNPSSIFEGDVSPTRRFLADHRCVIDPPRRVYLDIETDSRVPFASAVLGGARLLSWALVDEEGGKWTAVLEDDRDQAEAELWAALWHRMGDYDQVGAWNGDGFDFEVMKARCEDLAKSHNKTMEPFWEHRRRLLLVDHLACFRRHHMAAESGDDKTSFRLNDVCQAILGEGKTDFDSGKTWEAWAAGGAERQRLVDYNLQDTALLPKLEAATGYLELQQTIAEVTFTPVNSHGLKPMTQVDGYMLRMAHERQTHLPSKKPPTGNEEQYEGAFVLPPQALGVHRMVHVCDFASLYPTVIRTFNISPETKDTGIEPCTAFGTGVTFDTAVEGMLPRACREAMELRKHWNLIYKADPNNKAAERKSKAYKIFNNSMYGVIGSVWSRYYDPKLAESVTIGAKTLNEKTMEAAKAKGYEVLYGDSVTGDRTVVCKDPGGSVRILPIEELWSLGNPLRADQKEYVGLSGWLALTELGWKPIRAAMRHKTRKTVHYITTKHGQTRVTEDHGIMCNGAPTRPCDFTAFTEVKAPREEPEETIDLFRYVSHFSIARRYKGRNLVRKFVADEDWIYLDGWGDASKVKIRRNYRRGTAEYEALIRLTTCYAADGSASLRGEACRFLLSFCKSDRAWMELIAADLAKVIDGATVTGPFWSDTVWIVRSGTAAAACLFAALCGRSSRGKRYPSFMFRLGSAEFDAFFDTLGRTDGHRSGNGIEYTTNSQVLAASVSYILSQHGIEQALQYRESKAAWTIRTRPAGTERKRCKVKHSIQAAFDGYVYDLTVEGTHTFVDGIGRVLLHNTDSVFVKGCTVEEFKDFVGWCNSVLYPEILTAQGCNPEQRCISLAYEKAFDRLIFPLGNNGNPAAKRYIGSYKHYNFLPKTKPEIRGLEYMRADSIRYARRMQHELIKMLLSGEEDPERLHAWVRQQRETFFDAPMKVEDIAKSASISQPLGDYKTDAPHVRVAKELAAKGGDVSEGTRISYVIVDGRCSPTKVIAAEDFDGVTFDRFEYWNSAVYPPSMRVLSGAFPDQPWHRWIAKRPKPTLPGQLSLFGA